MRTLSLHCLRGAQVIELCPLSIYSGPKKRIPSFIFGITSVIQHRCYKQKFMARKREVLPPTTPLLCDHITYSKTNTTANICVKSFVLLTTVHLSLDSIKMMCGCSSQLQCSMCPPPFLITASRRLTPFIDTVNNETLLEFLPLGDYRSL